MTIRLPLALAAFALSALGLLAIGAAGGIDAVLGPSLAAVTATIFVLVR